MIVKAMERVGNKLRLLDQTRLPLETVFNDYEDYQAIIKAIQRLEVRGAPAIGISAAYALAIAVDQSGRYDSASIRQFGEEIKSARPTAVNLMWAIDRAMAVALYAEPKSKDDALKILWREAEAIHDEDREMCRKMGEYGAELIKDGDTLLTHCNAGALATGGIGTAIGVMYVCHEQGKRIKVYADETRPLLQGARLTTWELQRAGIDVTLNCDNSAGVLMSKGMIDHVIVGADRIAANGDTANKIGTYSLALLAVGHDVPFYVAAPQTTFDENLESGDLIEIEERAPEEVTEGFGVRIAPEGTDVYSPAFDVTPNELITAFITDTGVKPGGRGGSD